MQSLGHRTLQCTKFNSLTEVFFAGATLLRNQRGYEATGLISYPLVAVIGLVETAVAVPFTLLSLLGAATIGCGLGYSKPIEVAQGAIFWSLRTITSGADAVAYFLLTLSIDKIAVNRWDEGNGYRPIYHLACV